MKRIQFLGLCAAAALLPSAVLAQAAATKILLGFPPGASGDTMTRKIADKMRTSLGEPVIVENKPGAGGRIAMDLLKAAPPDGKTLIFTPLSPLTAAPWLYEVKYDPVKDFTPVAHVANFKYVFVVHPSVKANTLAEFTAAAKADRKLAFYSASAPGGGAHMALDAYSRSNGLDMSFVGYKGTGAAMTDLLGGQLPAFIGNAADFVEHIRAGKLKPLGVASTERSRHLPNVPTFKEQGYNIDAGGWFAIYAPANTPPDVVARVSKAVIDAVNDPEVRTLGDTLGLEMTGLGGRELAAIQKTDYEITGQRIKASGFKPQE
jgi:tripartite-type tricarboxylate transporter receptor subunit TctC